MWGSPDYKGTHTRGLIKLKPAMHLIMMKSHLNAVPKTNGLEKYEDQNWQSRVYPVDGSRNSSNDDPNHHILIKLAI